MGKKKKNIRTVEKPDNGGNGHATITGWGMVHCGAVDCGKPLGYFPPDVEMGDGESLELYCYECATALNQEEH